MSKKDKSITSRKSVPVPTPIEALQAVVAETQSDISVIRNEIVGLTKVIQSALNGINASIAATEAEMKALTEDQDKISQAINDILDLNQDADGKMVSLPAQDTKGKDGASDDELAHAIGTVVLTMLRRMTGFDV